MGSQPRRKGSRRTRRGRGGTGGEGAVGEDERKREEEAREINRIYRNARKKLAAALTEKNFSYAAEVATHVTVSRARIQDVVNLFVAGARAYREGKDQGWRPKPRELAGDGVRYAQEKTGYELTAARQQLFSNIIASNLRKVVEKQRRK